MNTFSWLRRLLPVAGQPTAGSVAFNASVVAIAFAVSRVLGMAREIVIAARFGTGDAYDAYIAAFRIPDLLFLLIMSGAFGSAFIPVFGGHLARDEPERAWRLANSMLTYTVLVLVVISQLILLFAGPLVTRVVAPELPPEGQELAINLTRLLLLSPLLLGLGAAAKGMLEAQDSFTLPAIAPILYNLGIIFGAIGLVPVFGIYGLAAGVILGALGHVTIQFAGLFARGFRFRPTLSGRSDGLGEVAGLMLPRIVTQAATQVNLVVLTNFASRLGEGRISALHYAQALALLPHGVLALSLSTVIFPMMARQFARQQFTELMDTLRGAIGPLLFLSIPAALGLLLFRQSIVQVVFQYGSFDPAATSLVADALGFFAIGLIARALSEPVTRAYFAMHDTRTPLLVALLTIAANIVLSWQLSGWLGHGGLALSLSITYILRMVLLTGILSVRTGWLNPGFPPSMARMAVSAVPFALVGLILAEPLARLTDPVDGRALWSYAVFGAGLAATTAAYFLTAYLLRVPEMARISGAVRRRMEH